MLQQLPEGLCVRNAVPEDHPHIISALSAWWGGRDLTWMMPRLFLNHFGNTSFVVEKGAALAAFLVGFFSPSRANEGYVHFVGVHPEYRQRGLGRYLYGRFFDLCRKDHRSVIRACTSPVNKGSVAFHERMGFELVRGDGEIDGFPVTLDYNKPGDPKVLFKITI